MSRFNWKSFSKILQKKSTYIILFRSAANIDEDSGKIIMEETLDDFMSMYFAGYVTTETAMNFLLNEVVRNPRVLELLVEEVRHILLGLPWGKFLGIKPNLINITL